MYVHYAQNQLSSLEGATGVTLLGRDRLGRARGITLTGCVGCALQRAAAPAAAGCSFGCCCGCGYGCGC